MKKKALEAVKYICQRTKIKPQVGIILGTGLGKLVKAFNIRKTFQYTDIPNFPLATVEFHKGKLIMGSLKQKKSSQCKGDFIITKGIMQKRSPFLCWL